jgi:hypothetical protein
MRKFKGKPINDTKENQVIREFRHVDHSLILKEVDVNLDN